MIRRAFPPLKGGPRAKKSPSSLKGDAKAIYRAGLDAVRAGPAVHAFLGVAPSRKGETLLLGRRRIPLSPEGRLIVVGAGKASAQMARAVERRLGHRISGGAVVTQYGHGEPCRRVEVFEANHPVPDEAGVAAARKIGEWVDGAGKDDVVLCLISGGGSALMPAPAEGLALEDKRAVTDALLRAGAPIEALNCVRKHLSALKGGHLARRAAPARVAALVVSDVVGDPFDVIASGPAFGDPSTFSQAREYLKRFGVWDGAPEAARRHIEAGVAKEIPETPAPDDPIFRRVVHECVASNEKALDLAERKARSLGYRTLRLTRRLQGEAREVGRFFAAIAADLRAEGHPIRPPACILAGGETTVTVRGAGEGGRSQELALSFAIAAEGLGDVCLLAAGTDGRDGSSPAAGGIVDGKTAKTKNNQSLDPVIFLRDNNSYRYLRRRGALIMTGPTGTNVMDLVVLLVGLGQRTHI